MHRSVLWVSVLTFVLLAALNLRWFQPALPRGFEIDVVFERGRAGLNEPLITSGEPNAGDFFWVRYQDETTAVLGYERWGLPQVFSAPFDVQPGTRRRLRVDIPAFSHVRGGSRGGGDQVRVQLEGVEVLSTTARFNLRKASRIFFGENGIDGQTCAREFSGTIYHPDGRMLRGNARHVFSWRERIGGWFTDGKYQVLFIALVSAGVAGLWQLLRPAPGARLRRAAGWMLAGAGTHRAFLASAAACVAAFAYVISGYSGRIWFEESFGSFFDFQALSLLHGRLDVPEPALSGEAFIVAKKYYGYFGITPALLRLPFALFDVAPGWWSRAYMVAEFFAALVAAYAILRAIVRLVAPERRAPAAWMVVVFTLNAGLGSTLFFLASRAYIYHEATLTGAMFALAAAACALRYLAAPASRCWLASLACGLLSLHARPPAGLFALVLLSCTALAVILRAWTQRAVPLGRVLRLNLALPVMCFLGVLSFNGLSYLKFGTFDGAPLKYHVQYHPERLAHIQGKNFHAANFLYDFTMYTWRPNFELRKTFPYFYITGKDPNIYPQARIDLAEPTVALPYAMPALVFLATVGATLGCWRWPQLRLPAAVLLLAVLPMAAAMFTAVAVSQRYTTDFCPWLICLAAIGLTAVEAVAPSRRRLFLLVVAPLTAGSIWVTVAITLHYQGTGVWGVPKDVPERYKTLRKNVDSFFGVRNPELYP